MSEQEFSASLEAPVELPNLCWMSPRSQGRRKWELAAGAASQKRPERSMRRLFRAGSNASPYSEESASGPEEDEHG
jgi:hypothetical protein